MANAKIQKAKEWMKYHAPELIGYSALTGVLGLYGWATYRAIKDEQEAIDQYNTRNQEISDWAVETSNAGNDVYALADGTFLVMPREAPREYVIK